MNKSDLLLEIGLEEIPARFVFDAMNQLAKKIEELLNNQNIAYGKVHMYSTPRRLAVLVEGVNEKQNDIHEEVKGPSKKIALDEEGNWTKAAIGFTKGQGKTVDDIYFKEINGVEYVHIEKHTKGKKTVDILSTLSDIIMSLNFPKNMHWANYDLKYIRPIRWLVALYGQEVIDITITNVQSGRITKGHRFLGTEIEITSPKQYKEQLLSQYVVVDYEERKKAIENQIHQLEESENWVIPTDEDLLEEVTNLVEYPTVLFGSFDESFLHIPEEVLITTMREHQRYFPVTNKAGELLPFFVTVRNGDHQNLDIVQRGNEKVLRARLQDAVFFYEEDQKLSIADCMERLKRVVYHEEIGTYEDKINRVKELSKFVLEKLNINSDEKETTLRAAEISKFDLVTQMVDELPELQGIMGEKYAILHGEKRAVAKAINEHYMPRHADGDLPKTTPGAIVSISDKLDTIASFFAIGLVPSGSQDPYSLRRQATGIVQILLAKEWNIDFSQYLRESIAKTTAFSKRSEEEIYQDMIAFFNLRFKYLLNEKGIRYDIVDAVLAAPLTAIKSLFEKAKVLQARKDEASFKENVEALSRVLNIAEKATNTQSVQVDLFENSYEKALYDQYIELEKQLEKDINEDEYYQALVHLKEAINDYFDHTMIMVEDETIRNNRLSFMKNLADQILSFAHFSKVIVK